MKVTLQKQSGGQYDITNAAARIEWSGSASAAVRQLTVGYLNAPNDNFSIPTIATGDFLSLTDDRGEEVFFGQVYGSEKSSSIGTLDFTAYDTMKNLLESQGQYNFKNVTAEAIAAQICGECGLPIRFLYPTGVNISSLLCDGMSLYDVIMAGYTKAHQITGDKYFAMIYKRGLGIYRSEWIVKGFTLTDSNITDSSITESMDNIVNRVLVYDEGGNLIGEAKDAGSQGVYGVFQQVYKQEENVDAMTAANNMLNVSPTQKITISSIGCIDCLSCYYVMVSDSATGLTGRYWISSDSHKWENGTYTMDLELTFDAVMEEREGSKEEEAAPAPAISGTTSKETTPKKPKRPEYVTKAYDNKVKDLLSRKDDLTF